MNYTASHQGKGSHAGTALCFLQGSWCSLVLHGFILTLYVKKRGIWKEKMYLRQENEIKLVVTSINQQSTEQPVGMGDTSAL